MYSGSGKAEPVVITGLGMVTSLGRDRETVWRHIREGRSGVGRLKGVLGIPDGMMLAAQVPGFQPAFPHEAKVVSLNRMAAEEALADAQIDWDAIDRTRFGCAISGHMGDTGWLERVSNPYDRCEEGAVQWWEQWMPNTACSAVANQHGLLGPRICHSTACASAIIDILSAVRSIQDGQCDIAIAGGAEAIHPLFAAGFYEMRVLANHTDPRQASRPFDRRRNGFVMGEGAAVLTLERLSHAQARGAHIYAEFLAGRMCAEAHHVTSLDMDSQALAYTIQATLRDADLTPGDVQYINAHGTGTQQNDVMETRGIRNAFGAATDGLSVSALKSMLGHLVNASGAVELGLAILALRDAFVPPTMNLTEPDPQCDLDCVPLVGRPLRMEHALKLSVAFGGHLVAVAVRRWGGMPAITHHGLSRAA